MSGFRFSVSNETTLCDLLEKTEHQDIQLVVCDRISKALSSGNMERAKTFLLLFRLDPYILSSLLEDACRVEAPVDVLELLCTQGAAVNTSNEGGPSPLMLASERVLVNVEVLLRHGANVNLQDRTGETALHYAAYRDKIDIVRFLCCNSADVNCVDEKGRTPLYFAAKHGSIDMVRVLIEMGASVNLLTANKMTPLMRAAKYATNNMERFLYILERSALLINQQDIYGRTALSCAAYNLEETSCPEVVRLLLEHGASPHLCLTNKRTPLMQAVLSDATLKGVSQLIQYSKNTLFNKDEDNWTALDFAANDEHVVTMVLLTEHGCTFTPRFHKDLDNDNAWYLSQFPLHHLRGLCSLLRREMVEFAIGKGERVRELLPKAIHFRDESISLENLFLLPYIHIPEGVTRFIEECAKEPFYQVEPNEMHAVLAEVTRTLDALARVVHTSPIVVEEQLRVCEEAGEPALKKRKE